MTWTAPASEREENTSAIYLADERAMLEGWLGFHRRTLLMKCAGLTADQLRQRAVSPSSLSLLGLVRHMAEVERWWFRRNFRGEECGDLYCFDDSDRDFDDVDTADPEADLATFAEECRLADAAAAGHSLDETFTTRRDRTMNLRWVYVHMVEEYARHNGHADLLRECIDGVTGD